MQISNKKSTRIVFEELEKIKIKIKIHFKIERRHYMEVIFTRRSIRKYKEQPVEKEKIEKLLRAAMQAPSAVNQQPWEFMVVEDRDNLDKLSQLTPYSKMLAHAPLAIIVLANMNNLRAPNYWQQDLGACTQNILLEATYVGLGSVWLGVAPDEERMNNIIDMFDLPNDILPFCVISIGYPEGEENRFIDRFDERKIHIEKYYTKE